MKTFIFLVLSVLIHCCIFSSPSLRNGQAILNQGLLLRNVKKSELLESEQTHASHQQRKPLEPQLSAPKALSKKQIAKLSYRDKLIYLIQERANHLQKKKRLPHQATVILRVDINQTGKVISSQVHEESSQHLLNKAALETVKSLKSYKPLPKTLWPEARFLVPVHFSQLTQQSSHSFL